MPDRFIHHLRVERPAAAEAAAGARERLKDKFPRTALRRMTHLGLLVGATLDGVGFSPDDAVVYATTFAETRALEDYLASFPTPSPLLFQTSIHPSAVQQVLVARQQPLVRFWPVTGRSRLVEHALLAALLEPAPRVVLIGGEERGTWMLEHDMAGDRAFAFALSLTGEAAGAIGRIHFEPRPNFPRGAAAPGPGPALGGLADALADRRPLQWQSGNGTWGLEWL